MDVDTRQDNGELSSPLPFVLFSPEETTLAALPFFALDHDDRRRAYHIAYETRLSNLDVSATLRWRVSADPVYGYPDAFDRKVFKIIEYLAVQPGFPIQNPIRFSLHQVLQLLGLAPFPSHLARVRSSIRRITAVTVHSDLTFLTGQRTGRSSQTFHLYDTASFREVSSGEATDNGHHSITFGAWYLENLNQQYLRPIDLSYFRSIRNPIASRLYELLTVKFEDVFTRSLSGWRVSYPVLCQILPVQQVFRSPQQQFKAAHDDLINTGYLNDVIWEKIDRTWMILYVPGKRAQTRHQGRLGGSADQQPRIAQSKKKPLPTDSQSLNRASRPHQATDQEESVSAEEQAHLELLRYWGLTERPFDTTPNPKFYYESDQHREALFKLQQAVDPHTGAMLLTGEIGCGKTLLTRTFVHNLDTKRYEVALLTNPRWNGVELLREILYQLGQEVETTDKTQILRRIEAQWFNTYQAGRHTVLIIDEAQLIEDFETFEELRLLLNFQLDDRHLVTLILVGQPELNAQINAIPQFEQRMAYRHHIQSLATLETSAYILHRLKIAGATREIFSLEAEARIYALSHGIPRRINTICNMCLLSGWTRRLNVIDPSTVDLSTVERINAPL